MCQTWILRGVHASIAASSRVWKVVRSSWPTFVMSGLNKPAAKDAFAMVRRCDDIAKHAPVTPAWLYQFVT
jgi:hypothetical protein